MRWGHQDRLGWSMTWDGDPDSGWVTRWLEFLATPAASSPRTAWSFDPASDRDDPVSRPIRQAGAGARGTHPGRLAVFPLLQALWFLLACHTQGAASVAFLGLSALFLALTLHITLHEHVHRGLAPGPRGRALLEGVFSLLTGLPFEGYRRHHGIHHEHQNSLDDVSTTWMPGVPGPIPRHWFSYSLGWPRQLLALTRRLGALRIQGRLPASVTRTIRWQQALLLVTLTGLCVIDSRLGALYLGMVYGGWVLTSLHNYGQHPPLPGLKDGITTFDVAWYNRVFCSNGLHAEHHGRPDLPWHELVPDPDSPKIFVPHLLAPLVTGSGLLVAAPAQEPP